MKEHGILFSRPMIPPLLADLKNVTRRLSKQWLKVKAGDRLWVRENFFLDERNTKGKAPQELIYDATPEWALDYTGALIRVTYITGEIVTPEEARRSIDSNKFWHRKPSIHMPRWASRILLECEEDARPERLRDITNQDAELEGVEEVTGQGCVGRCWRTYDEKFVSHSASARDSFATLWATLHTKPGERWEDNPEVVRVGRFHRV